jgi:hypothetical protein
MPVRCEISTMGVMSLRCVRAAQFGRILISDRQSRALIVRLGGVCAARARQSNVRRVDVEIVHQM